jgi:hypothetical protein
MADNDGLACADDAATPPREEELSKLGCQASQRIESAVDPLAMLADLTAAFPSVAKGLSRDKVEEEACAKFASNKEMLGQSSDSYLLINGLSVRPSKCNMTCP